MKQWLKYSDDVKQAIITNALYNKAKYHQSKMYAYGSKGEEDKEYWSHALDHQDRYQDSTNIIASYEANMSDFWGNLNGEDGKVYLYCHSAPSFRFCVSDYTDW